MGIVKKQAFSNTVIQYIGVLIGYVNIVLLFPKILEPEQFGLTRLLIAIATLFMQFSSLGANKILLRFYPFFKTEDNKHHGLLFLGLLIPFIGFLLLSGLYLVFENGIVSFYSDKAELFSINFLYTLPLAFLLLFTGILESYLQAMFDTVLSSFLKNVLLRIIWLVEIIAYAYNLISFQTFLNLFVYAYVINLLILMVYLKLKGKLNLKPEFNFLRPSLLKVIINYGLFSILSGVSHLLVSRIDILMLGMLSGLADTAVYSVAFYLASVISVPAQSIGRITFPIVSDKMKLKKYDEVNKLYKQTANTNLLLSGIIFICIWASIDNFFTLLPSDYSNGKWVIFFIGIAKVFEVSTGINWQIIVSSKYYRFDTIAAICLVIITAVGNYILIPTNGITGAALASLISLVAYNLAKMLFIYFKLNMQPFTTKTLIGIVSLIIPLLLVNYIPFVLNIYIDTIIRSVALITVFAPLVYFLKVSLDINEVVDKTLARFGIRN